MPVDPLKLLAWQLLADMKKFEDNWPLEDILKEVDRVAEYIQEEPEQEKTAEVSHLRPVQ